VTIEPKGMTIIDTLQKLVDEPFDQNNLETLKERSGEVVIETQNNSSQAI